MELHCFQPCPFLLLHSDHESKKEKDAMSKLRSVPCSSWPPTQRLLARTFMCLERGKPWAALSLPTGHERGHCHWKKVRQESKQLTATPFQASLGRLFQARPTRVAHGLATMGRRWQQKGSCSQYRHTPLFAGDDSNLLALSVRCHQPRLPPLIVGGIDNVQDIPVRETESLAGQAAVPSAIIVKEGPAQEEENVRQGRCWVQVWVSKMLSDQQDAWICAWR